MRHLLPASRREHQCGRFDDHVNACVVCLWTRCAFHVKIAHNLYCMNSDEAIKTSFCFQSLQTSFHKPLSESVVSLRAFMNLTLYCQVLFPIFTFTKSIESISWKIYHRCLLIKALSCNGLTFSWVLLNVSHFILFPLNQLYLAIFW